MRSLSFVVVVALSCGLVWGKEWQHVATLLSDAEAGETLLVAGPICIPAAGAAFMIEAREGPLTEVGRVRYVYGQNLIAYRLLENDFLAGSRIYQEQGLADCRPAAQLAEVEPLVLDCEPGRVEIQEHETANLEVRATGGGESLRYSWMVDGNPVAGDQATLRFAGADSVGSHTISAQATTGAGLSARCDFQVRVNPRANRSPTLRLTIDREQVFAGDPVRATAAASDPDGDPLSYAWSVDNQSRSETSSQLEIDTTGLAGGHHSVSLTVRDNRQGSVTEVRAFSVRERISLQMKGTRVNNVVKAHLDEMALRMAQNPRLMATVVGSAEGGETEEANRRVAQTAAENVRDYLVSERGLPAPRIETQPTGAEPQVEEAASQQQALDLRIDIELFVP